MYIYNRRIETRMGSHNMFVVRDVGEYVNFSCLWFMWSFLSNQDLPPDLVRRLACKPMAKVDQSSYDRRG